MVLTRQGGIQQINKFVSKWTRKYLHLTTFLKEEEGSMLFMCEFSLPTPTKPVPIATVRVFFTLQDRDDLPPAMYFRFQKDSLIHSPDSTIRISCMESFIETLLKKKLLTRNSVFFLGTDFERTRIQDERLDALLYEEVKPPLVEKVFLDSTLLDDIKIREVVPDPTHIAEAVHKRLTQCFSAADKQRLGVISSDQFHGILNGLRIGLTKEECTYMVEKADSKGNGLIRFDQFKLVVWELVQGLLTKDFAVQQLRVREEEYELTARLILHSDPIHELGPKIQQQLKTLDEDETGRLKISDIRKGLQKLNQHISLEELGQLIKELSRKYGYNEVPWRQVHDELRLLKTRTIKEFLLENNLSLLQMHLRATIEQLDHSKIGKLKPEQIMQIFEQEGRRISLSRMQKLVVRSALRVDDFGLVEYRQQSKLLAEIIKMLFKI